MRKTELAAQQYRQLVAAVRTPVVAASVEAKKHR
jgi:hypothetical protein